MWSSLLALTLAAAPVAPVGLREAIVVPHPRTGLPAVRAFLDHAGLFASPLLPSPWGLELGSAISLDLFDLAGWEAAGLDLDAPLTFSMKPDEWIVVAGVKDPKKFLARAQVGLGSSGTVTASKVKGAELRESHHPGAHGPELAGAAGVRGHWAALMVRGTSDRWLLSALDAHPLTAMDHAKGLAGDAFVITTDEGGSTAVIGVAPSAMQLDLDGRITAAKGVLKVAPRDAFADMHPHALLWANADTAGWGLTTARAELAGWVRFLVLQVCRDCSMRAEDPLAATLEGPVAFLGTGLAPEQSHSSHDLDRYFLFPEAQAAQVKDPVAAHVALAGLLEELKAHQAAAESLALPHGEHYQLRLGKQRIVYFGLVGSVLYLANTADARDTLLGSLPESPHAPAHAGLVHFDGDGAAKVVSRLSMFDAGVSSDLAALFGIAIEGAPLLRAIGEVDLTLDAEGTAARVKGTLHLAPPKPGP